MSGPRAVGVRRAVLRVAGWLARGPLLVLGLGWWTARGAGTVSWRAVRWALVMDEPRARAGDLDESLLGLLVVAERCRRSRWCRRRRLLVSALGVLAAGAVVHAVAARGGRPAVGLVVLAGVAVAAWWRRPTRIPASADELIARWAGTPGPVEEIR